MRSTLIAISIATANLPAIYSNPLHRVGLTELGLTIESISDGA